ncbi:alpha/beta hydrolase [Streptomyces boninensis]|uniref:alpha/beta hydrolase n=1 Tax=Streptomyces boninensis TaxID=2039455 RepID=UPI003B20E7D0
MSGTRRLRRPRRKLAAVLLAAALALTGGALGTAADAGTAPLAADDGARITATKAAGAQAVDITVQSPALGGKSAPVRILLPKSYETAPERTYPVLYLQHGAGGKFSDWTEQTDVEEFMADKDVITVIPDAGPTGIVSKWWNFGSNSPDYDTFQNTEVWQLLQKNYRANGTRAVAGISTGGYSAMAAAVRHPGAYTAVASYSGILDTLNTGMPTTVSAIVGREFQFPTSLWGGPILNRGTWKANNPYTQMEKLKGTSLYISQGTGFGPNKDFANLIVGGVLEGALWVQAHSFTDRLEDLGIPATVHYYQGGSHEWPHWQTEFKASWPVLAKGLGV